MQGNAVTSGNFTFTDTSIEGVKIIDVKAYGDERGYFMETYKRLDFAAGGIDADNRRQFYIPRGFAHGFLVLSDVAESRRATL